MLNKIKYESIEYGRYEKLRKIFLQSKVNIKQLKELNL